LELRASEIARVVVVEGTDYDARRRKDYHPLIDTKDTVAIQSLISALDHDDTTPSDIALLSWPLYTSCSSTSVRGRLPATTTSAVAGFE
jgi:hypothetical protein